MEREGKAKLILAKLFQKRHAGDWIKGSLQLSGKSTARRRRDKPVGEEYLTA